MIRDIIPSHLTIAEWPKYRNEIHARILATMGTFPVVESTGEIELLKKEQRDSYTAQEFRFNVLPNITTYGSVVAPATSHANGKSVLCLHGTDTVLGHKNVMSPSERPNRQYAIELAQKGFTTIAVDQFGFGQGNGGQSLTEAVKAFYETYPDWSIDGIRLRIHQRIIDLLPQMADVDVKSVGCIGHSLGGRSALYLAAFDERIRACIPSAGVSPNLTNVFRNRPCSQSLSPILDHAIAKTGVSPFEYQELLSLVAPRSLLLLEPWNDTCNPMIEPVLRCFEKARFVFQINQVSENLQVLCHGDGHETVPRVREYAYSWLIDQFDIT